MPAVPNSILDTTKKLLGLEFDYVRFDEDVIIHINSTFARLAQLGIGPKDGFEIEDSSSLWSDFLGGNKLLNSTKSYMYLAVRMLFDPPTTSFDLTAKKEQIEKAEWLLSVAGDKVLYAQDGSTYSGGAFMWTLEGEDIWPPEAESGDLGVYPPSGNVWRKA